MSPEWARLEGTRRDLLARAGALVAAAGILSASPSLVEGKDYVSRREALDDLDRLAGLCGMRIGTVRRSRSGVEYLALRFLNALARHRSTREDVRRRFGLPRGAEPSSQLGVVDADLPGLRQALDDLMIGYAESLPVFGDATVVSRLAVDMVEVSKLRTVIDMWVEAEAA